MGTFCEVFEITKIEATSTTRKRVQKKKAQSKFKRHPKQPKPFIKREQSKPAPPRKTQQKEKDHCLLQMWQNRS